MKRTRKKLRTHERIQLTARRYNAYPKRFKWRGRSYSVTSVQEAWTKMQRGASESARHYFRVRCKEGIFEIFQDTGRNAWYVTAQVG